MEADVLVRCPFAVNLGTSLVKQPLQPLVRALAILFDDYDLLDKDNTGLVSLLIASDLGRKHITTFEGIGFQYAPKLADRQWRPIVGMLERLEELGRWW